MDPKTLAHRCLLLLAIALPDPAAALTASVEANGYSFSLAPAATNAGFTLFFTTYDGSTGVPLQDCAGAYCTVSQEASPTSVGSKIYRTDYFAVDSIGVFEYGAASVTVSANDSDSDGILDPLERTQSGNFSFSGSTTPHYNAFDVYVQSTISGSIQRSANSLVGTYSGSFSNVTQSASFAGAYSLSGASGYVEYELGGDLLEWTLTQRSFSGTIRTFTGISQYERNGTIGISAPSFSLFDSASGLYLFVNAASLTRVGSSSTFRGTVTLADGGVDTSWADYTTYRVEVTDPNDTDDDGVPDILSVPEPDESLGALFAIASLYLAAQHRGVRGSI